MLGSQSADQRKLASIKDFQSHGCSFKASPDEDEQCAAQARIEQSHPPAAQAVRQSTVPSKVGIAWVNAKQSTQHKVFLVCSRVAGIASAEIIITQDFFQVYFQLRCHKIWDVLNFGGSANHFSPTGLCPLSRGASCSLRGREPVPEPRSPHALTGMGRGQQLTPQVRIRSPEGIVH